MPLNAKGEKIKSAMEKEYGSEKGKRVFYASENKGTIKGIKKHDRSGLIDRTEKRLKKAFE
jgi:hypothetical protein